MEIQILSGSKSDLVYEHQRSNNWLCTSSDGPQPHFITIEFPRKVAIQVRDASQPIFAFPNLIYPLQKISIHLNYPHDDSYTPSTLAIRAGTGPSDLQDVRVVTLDKPDGWITFDVSSEPNEDGDGLYDCSNSYLSLTLPGIYSGIPSTRTFCRSLSLLTTWVERILMFAVCVFLVQLGMFFLKGINELTHRTLEIA